ncbi:MAG: 50S ribosomal protein L29 [Candidatus Gracilibacteria bacterium]|nr:50S ribosomal protein L29 [Candidatus Gracilibacteria bacterium]
MSTKTIKEIRALDDKSLQKELEETKSTYKRELFENSHGNLKTTSNLKELKKQSARIKTVQTEHRRAEAAKAKAEKANS